IWRNWADEVDGAAIDAGHLQAEEAPEAVLAHLLPFLRRHAQKRDGGCLAAYVDREFVQKAQGRFRR
ncbi:MAG: hypothetical protein ROW39_01305, partial [Anaerolineaceae bacterium]